MMDDAILFLVMFSIMFVIMLGLYLIGPSLGG